MQGDMADPNLGGGASPDQNAYIDPTMDPALQGADPALEGITPETNPELFGNPESLGAGNIDPSMDGGIDPMLDGNAAGATPVEPGQEYFDPAQSNAQPDQMPSQPVAPEQPVTMDYIDQGMAGVPPEEQLQLPPDPPPGAEPTNPPVSSGSEVVGPELALPVVTGPPPPAAPADTIEGPSVEGFSEPAPTVPIEPQP
jgi:hypothetical protein